MIRKVKTGEYRLYSRRNLATFSDPMRSAFSCCWGWKTRAGRVELEKASRASQNN